MILPAPFVRAFIAAALATTPALAGSAKEFKRYQEQAPAAPEIATDVLQVESSYVGSSDFRRGDGDLGSQDVVQASLRYDHRMPLNGPWYLKLGVLYERFDFGSSGAPVPNHLQAAAGVISLEYFEGDKVGFFIQSAPGVYFQNDISTGAFDAPTTIALAYPIFGGDRFYLVGGVSMSLLSEYPFLPIVGALWHISPEWELRAYLPRPRLIFKPGETLHFWAGGELTGGSFRTDSGVKPGELSEAVVTYYETRAGAGVTWKPCPTATVDLGAGWAFQRNFSFHRADEDYRLEGAPYVRVSVTTQF